MNFVFLLSWVGNTIFLKQTFLVCPYLPQKAHNIEVVIWLELALLILEILTKILLANCLSYYATRDFILFFGMGRMGFMSKTCDLILLYWSFKPLKNCIAWPSHFLWLMMEPTKQEHFTEHVHIALGLKLSNSSQISLSLVKYSVTDKFPRFKEATSSWRSEILDKSPWKYMVFKSFQISKETSIHIILCWIGRETKCNNHETTILLHMYQGE